MKYPENSNWVNQRPNRLQHFDVARLIQRDLKCGLKALLVTLALMGLVACDSSNDSNNSNDASNPLQAADFSVRESVGQLHVTGAEEGLQLEVYDASGNKVSSGETDFMGSLIFRSLPAGSDYSVRETMSNPVRGLENLEVWSAEGSLPETDFYRNQSLQPGFNYITTRDGTRLSA